MSEQILKPNVELPLAASYNTRGQYAGTSLYTDGVDQRKINSIYRLVRNAMTGRTTLYLAKRPGVADQGSSFGTTGQVAYLVVVPGTPSALDSSPWVFSVSTNDVRASSSSTTTTIFTEAGYMPTFVDKTAISGTDTIVMQARKATGEQRIWYASAIGSWTEITDADFTALTLKGKMEFIDGYALIMDSRNRIYNSDINSLSSWGAANFITKQIQQDIPVGLARFNQQIIAFGEKTMEVFQNAGNPSGSPLSSVPSLFKEYGMFTLLNVSGKTHYYQVLGEHLYFVGRGGDTEYEAAVFAYNGQTVEKVSTPFIDSILATTTHYSVNVVGYSGYNAIAISLDLTTATTQRWLMFFPEWNEWFEWNSTVFTPVNNGTYFLGVGSSQHKVYYVGGAAADNWQDAGSNFTVTHQFMIPPDGNHRKFMPMFSLVGDTARAASNVAVSFSDDDWQTFSTARNIDMTSDTKALFRCGSFRKRGVKMTHTANTDLRLEKVAMRVE